MNEKDTAVLAVMQSYAEAMGLTGGDWCAVGDHISQTLWGVSEARAKAAVAQWGCGVAQPEAEYQAAVMARRAARIAMEVAR